MRDVANVTFMQVERKMRRLVCVAGERERQAAAHPTVSVVFCIT